MYALIADLTESLIESQRNRVIPKALLFIARTWTRLFWGTDCWRSPKAASLCSASIERTREHLVRCCHSTHSLLFTGFPGVAAGGQQQFATQTLCLGTPRPGTEVSRALRARHPKRVRKESARVCRGLRSQGAPESPKSAPGVRKESKKRSFGLFFDSFRTPGRTLWVLWGLGPEALAHPFGLFRGLPGPSDLCAWPWGSQPSASICSV